MKKFKITLAAIAAVVSINCLNAQNTFPTAAATNVGIGTTAPSKPLHIKSTTDEILRLETPDATLGFMYTGWYNGATRRAWTGLNGTSFNFNVENGTNKFSFNGGDVNIGNNLTVNGTNISILQPTTAASESRFHLYNGGNVAEWLFGQKSGTSNDFTLSKKVGTTETDYFTLTPTGNLGIGGALTTGGDVTVGTAASPNNLGVTGNATITGDIVMATTSTIKSPTKLTLNSGTCNLDLSPTGATLSNGANVNFSIVTGGSGYVKIGAVTTPNVAGYKLFVDQGILTEKVKVAVATSANWADYVFASDYQLMPLSDVENFIKTNNHLPNVPSAKEMVQEGNDLGKTDAKLLEKIEELTLYMIQSNQKMEMLAKKVEILEIENACLKQTK